MVKFKELPQIIIDNDNIGNISIIGYKNNNDFRINYKDLNVKKRYIYVTYNEEDNVYDFPENVIINRSFFNKNNKLVLYIGYGERNTKMGVSLRLSDGNIIPIVHSSLYNHSLISKTGLNEGSNEFYYDINLNKLIFTSPLTIGVSYPFDSVRPPNGFIQVNQTSHNIDDYPVLKYLGFTVINDLQNRYAKDVGNNIIRSLHEDALPEIIQTFSHTLGLWMYRSNSKEGDDLNSAFFKNSDATSYCTFGNDTRFSEETRAYSACYNLIMRI